MRLRRWLVFLGVTGAVGVASGLTGWYLYPRIEKIIVSRICEFTVMKVVAAPNAMHGLLIFDRDCGATSPFGAQVGLLKDAKRVSDDIEPFFVVKGRHNLNVRWTVDGKIEIDVPPGQFVYRQDTTVDSIPVSYR